MQTSTPITSDRIFNLHTNHHGNHDHDWDDFLDFSVATGLKQSSNDFTYGAPTDREHILLLSAMSKSEQSAAIQCLLKSIFADKRIFNPGMWIGTREGYNYSLPCTVKRSRKYNGPATLINIVSKKDRYNREIYKAYIVGADNLRYYVSPNCIVPDHELIQETISQLSLDKLADFMDELIYGHWNVHPYNRHLFRLPKILKNCRTANTFAVKGLPWAWKVKSEAADCEEDFS